MVRIRCIYPWRHHWLRFLPRLFSPICTKCGNFPCILVHCGQCRYLSFRSTDSEGTHHCCHLSNKVENIDCMSDISHTLQLDGRRPKIAPDPHLIMVSGPHPSPYLEQHLNRFIRFTRVHGCCQQTGTRSINSGDERDISSNILPEGVLIGNPHHHLTFFFDLSLKCMDSCIVDVLEQREIHCGLRSLLNMVYMICRNGSFTLNNASKDNWRKYVHGVANHRIEDG